jgi:amidase
VAAGLAPVAHASDAGGSIRIPAAWCGVVGFKPSRGRITPVAGTEVLPNLTEGVIGRSVRDVASVVDAMAGNLPGDLYRAPPLATDLTSQVSAEPGSLRIGIQAARSGYVVDSAVSAAVSGVGRLLEDLGHQVSEAHPPLPEEDPDRWPPILGSLHQRRYFQMLRELIGRPIAPTDVERWTWSFAAPERVWSADELFRAQTDAQDYAMRAISWWSDFDIAVSPAAAIPAPPLRLLGPEVSPPQAVERVIQLGCFRLLPNITGQPAVSLPLAWTEEGMPIGVQLVAAPGREDVLIRLGAQLERARPWLGHLSTMAGRWDSEHGDGVDGRACSPGNDERGDEN